MTVVTRCAIGGKAGVRSSRRRQVMRNVVMLRALSFGGLIVLSGCATDPNDAPPGVRLVVLASEYSREDTITAAVINGSPVGLSHGSTPCATGIERRVDGGWGDRNALYFTPGESVACDAANYGVGPHDGIGISQPVREWMAPGEYRLTFNIYWPLNDGRSYTLVSNTFTILPE
jgi:hypothetical protein